MSNTQPGTFKALIEAKEQREKEEKAKLELVPQTESSPNLNNSQLPNQPNVPNQDYQPNIPNQPIKFTVQKKSKSDAQSPIAPKKDFAKVANSIAREAVPNGLFKGMSKNTYDALYLKTRGAINPVRSIRATKPDLMRWAGVSDVTLDRHLKYLRAVGLIRVEFIIGSHEGNLYEVRIPEELQEIQMGQTNPTNLTNLTKHNIPTIVGYHIPNNVGYVGWVNLVENKGLKDPSKTSLKTNTNIDDEPFGAMNDVLTNICQKVSGKMPQKADRAKWKELAELLVMELEIAAARTELISNVPAFLTEHLRRRLVKKLNLPNMPNSKADKPLALETTESEQPVYEAESLTQQGREVVLKTFKEYVEKGQRDFVLSFEETYTKEDWLYLMKNLQ